MKRITYADIRKKVKKPYTMSLVGELRQAVVAAVNQGIDSRLEACFCPDRGDVYQPVGPRLNCVVSAESLPVLLRRLLEIETALADEEADATLSAMVADVLETLNIPVETGCFEIVSDVDCPDEASSADS